MSQHPHSTALPLHIPCGSEQEASEHVTDTNTDSCKCDGRESGSNVVEPADGHLQGAAVADLLWWRVVWCGVVGQVFRHKHAFR